MIEEHSLNPRGRSRGLGVAAGIPRICLGLREAAECRTEGKKLDLRVGFWLFDPIGDLYTCVVGGSLEDSSAAPDPEWLPSSLSTGRRAWHRGWAECFTLLQGLRLFLPAHRSLTGSPRSSSESHSPLYLHPPKCTSCGSQSPQHTEMCLHTTGPTFPEEMGETQSEYSDSSCGESLPLPLLAGEKAGPHLCSLGFVLLFYLCCCHRLGDTLDGKSVGT